MNFTQTGQPNHWSTLALYSFSAFDLFLLHLCLPPCCMLLSVCRFYLAPKLVYDRLHQMRNNIFDGDALCRGIQLQLAMLCMLIGTCRVSFCVYANVRELHPGTHKRLPPMLPPTNILTPGTAFIFPSAFIFLAGPPINPMSAAWTCPHEFGQPTRTWFML